MQELLERHGEVFQAELGTLRGYEAKIHVDPGAKPRFCKARTVPYALREKVEQELAASQRRALLNQFNSPIGQPHRASDEKGWNISVNLWGFQSHCKSSVEIG